MSIIYTSQYSPQNLDDEVSHLVLEFSAWLVLDRNHPQIHQLINLKYNP